MSAQTAAKAAGQVAKAAGDAGSKKVLHKGAKRDPELYILGSIMAGALGLVGYYFGRKPTSSTSEAQVVVAEHSMPWQKDSADTDTKYQYHPGGDPKNPPKDAPSALHSVIVPNVNLPKKDTAGSRQGAHYNVFRDLHDKFNKWGKDDY